MKSVWDKYRLDAVITPDQFNRRTVPHFYVIDESHHYQMEYLLRQKAIKIIRKLPTYTPEFTILECTF